MVGDWVPKNQISVGSRDGPNFVFGSDIPSGVLTVWVTQILNLRLQGVNKEVRKDHSLNPFPDYLVIVHDFLRAVKSYVHFGDRPLATTPSAKR